jgi:hypothetical protein
VNYKRSTCKNSSYIRFSRELLRLQPVKGFAIASAVDITETLFAAYVTFLLELTESMSLKAPVLAMLWEGMIPVVFSALAIL